MKRWSSWYDPALVTQAGEDILAKYDDAAVTELRRHKLVWSSWGPMQELNTGDHLRPTGSAHGLRTLKGADGTLLRLFFLSLLWRAAETSLPEFGNVVVEGEHLAQLRDMVCSGNPEPLDLFPTSFTQLSTLGVTHNHTVLDEVKFLDFYENEPKRGIPIFRFYLDGLIAHVHRPSAELVRAVEFGPFIVGAHSDLMISTVTYEESYQRKNLLGVMLDTEHMWPGSAARFNFLSKL